MNKIVTVSREFGSGGREIAKRLSDKFGIAYYDSNIISLLARETGLREEYLKNISEKGIYPYAFQFGKSFGMMGALQKEQNDILIEQRKILKQAAQAGDCIIVGRGADVILAEYMPFRIFVYAKTESKIKRCMVKAYDGEGLDRKQIKSKMEKIDKDRKNYHDVISSSEWGAKENYDLCVNTTNINIKEIIDPLADYINKYFEGAAK